MSEQESAQREQTFTAVDQLVAIGEHAFGDAPPSEPNETDELLLRWSGKLTRDEIIRSLRVTEQHHRRTAEELYAELRQLKAAR